MTPSPPPDAHRPARFAIRSSRLASVSREERDGVIIVTVQGEIDVSNVTEVGIELTEISNQPLGLVVDLGEVTHLDSAGIALLYDLHTRLDRRGLCLVVVVPTDAPARRVLELTAFDSCAHLAEEVNTAAVKARNAGRSCRPTD
jgi:anti-anti-sigma factor